MPHPWQVPPVDCQKSLLMCPNTRYRAGESLISTPSATYAYPNRKLRGVLSNITNSCVLSNATESKLKIMVTVGTDTILLLITMLGLFRLFHDQYGASNLGRLLWTQVWLGKILL